MKRVNFYVQLLTNRRVRLFQDGHKEQVFTLEQLNQALENERDFSRLLALNEAKDQLERAMGIGCICLERIGDNGPCPKHGNPVPA